MLPGGGLKFELSPLDNRIVKYNNTKIRFYFLAGPPNSSGDANKKCFLFGQRQRGGARHSGAPMLRRYATTSALLRWMAHSSAVLPRLQGR